MDHTSELSLSDSLFHSATRIVVSESILGSFALNPLKTSSPSHLVYIS